MTPRLAVIGCGSLGLLLAAYFSASMETVLVCRSPEQVEAINAHGVHIHREGGIEAARPRAVHVSAVQRGGFSYAVLAVKAYDLREGLEVARNVLRREGLAAVIALGQRVWRAAEQTLGEEKVATLSPYLGAMRVGPNRVLHEGGRRLVLTGPREKLEELVDALKVLDLEVEVDERGVWAWDYALTRAAAEPLAAVLGVPYGYLAKSSSARTALSKVVGELKMVASSLAVQLPRALEDAVSSFLSELASCKPPMLADLEAGRPTEVDFLLGDLIEVKRASGARAYFLETLYLIIKSLEECGLIARGQR